jgi:hypothetical protein
MKCELSMILFHFTRKFGKHYQSEEALYCSLIERDLPLDIQRNENIFTTVISCVRMTVH